MGFPIQAQKNQTNSPRKTDTESKQMNGLWWLAMRFFFHTFRLNTLRSSNMAGRKTTAKGGCNPWRIQYIQLSNSNICPYVLRNLCIFWVKQIYLFFRIRWFWGILEPSIAKCVISTYIPQFSTWTWIIFHTCPLSQTIFSGRFWTCIFHLQVQFQLFQ